MIERPPTFYGSVLKAIACTPNRNPDGRAHQAEVLPRSRRLREAQAALGETPPNAEQIRAALNDLIAILDAKCVAGEEVRDWLGEIATSHPAAATVVESLSVPGRTRSTGT